VTGVALQDVRKSFGAAEVIGGVTLDLPKGAFVVFVGPSGCGKSTLLRMIAGLEPVSSGAIRIGDKLVTNTPARDRDVAMVFQNYALYPHMTVRDNMAFGLENLKTPRAEIADRVTRAAEILQLSPYLGRKPRALSGGQRQRVAIGRAIVRDPEVFLFDEPLSNLDAALRVQTRTEIARLHHRLGATMIYVTHDQTEAMTMANIIVVLRAGKVEQVGTPIALYERPANQFVAGFLGSPRMNFLAAVADGAGTIQVAGATLAVDAPLQTGQAVTLGLRPDVLQLAEGPLRGTVDVVEELGNHKLVYLTLGDGTQVVAEHRGQPPVIGDRVPLAIGAGTRHIFDQGGATLASVAAAGGVA
jgi:ABC-type sugar transport system ATPase subunit